MNNEFNNVKEFHQRFNHPASEIPVSLTMERAKKRYIWMEEKLNEFIIAAENQDIVEQADAMIDVIYFALGTLVEMGVRPDALFYIVQKANMSKLWNDGKAHYNEIGKVIKPAGWKDPHEDLKKVMYDMMNGCFHEELIASSIDSDWEAVQKFHQSFNHPISETPVSLTLDRAKTRCAWMEEEINEFIIAAENQDIVEQADAMIDAIYFALGTLVEMGIRPSKLFQIIQKANMSKLWGDGKAHYDEYGKVIKPAGWKDPHEDISSVIKRMCITPMK